MGSARPSWKHSVSYGTTHICNIDIYIGLLRLHCYRSELRTAQPAIVDSATINVQHNLQVQRKHSTSQNGCTAKVLGYLLVLTHVYTCTCWRTRALALAWAPRIGGLAARRMKKHDDMNGRSRGRGAVTLGLGCCLLLVVTQEAKYESRSTHMIQCPTLYYKTVSTASAGA